MIENYKLIRHSLRGRLCNNILLLFTFMFEWHWLMLKTYLCGPYFTLIPQRGPFWFLLLQKIKVESSWCWNWWNPRSYSWLTRLPRKNPRDCVNGAVFFGVFNTVWFDGMASLGWLRGIHGTSTRIRRSGFVKRRRLHKIWDPTLWNPLLQTLV